MRTIAICLDVAYMQYTLAHNEYLIISDAGQRLALRHGEILFIEVQSPYVLIYMQSKKNQSRFATVSLT